LHKAQHSSPPAALAEKSREILWVKKRAPLRGIVYRQERKGGEEKTKNTPPILSRRICRGRFPASLGGANRDGGQQMKAIKQRRMLLRKMN
jgi:hypothetical protein